MWLIFMFRAACRPPGEIILVVRSNVMLTGLGGLSGGLGLTSIEWILKAAEGCVEHLWSPIVNIKADILLKDYLEYRFGTLKTIDERNYVLGLLSIPYYIFLGVAKFSPPVLEIEQLLEQLDAACTESPYLSPRKHRLDMSTVVETETRSKAFDCAIVNLSANLPLPSTFYQNTQWRIYYDEHLRKHTQFNNKYIYAFTWEDSRVDHRLLKISSDDVMLCITSAGDNLLDYLISSNPRRIHAVDLNPNQNHLLELKIAAYQALPYGDFWKLFGDGKHHGFQEMLINKLSPYMSSQALQFWLNNAGVFKSSGGLFETGGLVMPYTRIGHQLIVAIVPGMLSN